MKLENAICLVNAYLNESGSKSSREGFALILDRIKKLEAELEEFQKTIHNTAYTKCQELLKECYISMSMNGLNQELCDEIEAHFT